ncbi:nucleotide excision repair TFIIH subunit [Heliocybe sulcata]|uniref:General transcription and DNA repair factor IIH subunit TFB5 n=1 Tax=Heliocybe sulcata TaxID=5364 RepID=A0A5C3MR36_9AGAM|nr:nucleotide excision repair TFIIH subunit [Heliocybe sulcata]
MKAIRGVLLTCDSAVKQILLTINEREGNSFIIEDLDDHHLVIKADEEYRVRKELEAELEKNTYSLEG